MGNLIKAIYEHLITKPKYNKKCIECEALKDDIARLNIRKKEQKDIFNSKKEEWDATLKEQEEEIIKLKRKLVKLKDENKKVS